MAALTSSLNAASCGSSFIFGKLPEVPVGLSSWPSLPQHAAFGIEKIWPLVLHYLALETAGHVRAPVNLIKLVGTILVFKEYEIPVVLALKK
jgi:hypothetical protein